MTALTGGAAGLVFGIAQFAVLEAVASRLEREKGKAPVARIMRNVATLDLFLLPVLGYVIGGLLAGPATAALALSGGVA